MIYAVKVAVSKRLPGHMKNCAWELVEVYDKLLREHGVPFVDWSILDRGKIFHIVGLVPGDSAVEACAAKDALQTAMREAQEEYRLERGEVE